MVTHLRVWPEQFLVTLSNLPMYTLYYIKSFKLAGTFKGQLVEHNRYIMRIHARIHTTDLELELEDDNIMYLRSVLLKRIYLQLIDHG